ncbi:MAG: hypothetical protein HN368_03495 [Spirochaetales bacterium]|nr:hypothetical protein [Spirochaetales bacterium]
MRGAIAWSYVLLEDDEKRLFARLSVFVGGFTIDAVEAVCAPGQAASDVLDGVTALEEKSLISRRECASELRLFLLQTIREFAVERLDDTGETEALRRSHADFYLAVSETPADMCNGKERFFWLDRFDREYPNIRAALGWLCSGANGQLGLGCALARKLVWYWYARGLNREGLKWLELAMAGAGKEPSADLARLVTFAGAFNYELGDKDRGKKLLERALVMSREVGDARTIALSFQTYAEFAIDARESPMQKRSFLEESLRLAREADDKETIFHAIFQRARLSAKTGELGKAEEIYRQCVDFCSQNDFTRHAAMARLGLARVTALQGDFRRAVAVTRECLAVLRREKYQNSIAFALHDLGEYACELGDLDSAKESFVEALQLFEKIGMPGGTAACLRGLAEVAKNTDMNDRAVRLFGTTAAYFDLIEESIVLLAHDHSGSINSLHEELGEEFDALWHEGRGMSINQAVKLALDGG